MYWLFYLALALLVMFAAFRLTIYLLTRKSYNKRERPAKTARLP